MAMKVRSAAKREKVNFEVVNGYMPDFGNVVGEVECKKHIDDAIEARA
jgi:hypothetical protein